MDNGISLSLILGEHPITEITGWVDFTMASTNSFYFSNAIISNATKYIIKKRNKVIFLNYDTFTVIY